MRREVAELAAAEGLGQDQAFSAWYCQVALHHDRAEALDASRYDGGNDRGIDVFWVDDEQQRVVIGSSKYYKKSIKAPTPADVALLLDTIEALSDAQELRDDGRHDLAEAADDLQAAREQGYAVRLQMVYPGPVRPSLEAQIRAYNRSHADEDVTAELVPLKELERLFGEYTGVADRVLSGSISLVGNCAYEQTGPYGRALVATATASSLRSLYDTHGDRLFAENIRLFLGSRKGSVNAEIRETLDDPADRVNFFAYNNGITVVAADFVHDSARAAVELSQFSIVNGCQTTVLIGNSSPDTLAGVTVLVRVVAAPPKLVDSIIRYTNSQTPIRVWERSARDKAQQRIRRELDSLPEPWFYALRRGEFETLADKTRYGNPVRLVPFPQGIQFLAAFRGLPVQAYKDKARLFTAHRDQILGPGSNTIDVLWAWQVGQSVVRVLPAVMTELAADADATLVLMRGAQFYATAVASQLLRERNGADFTARVDSARLTDKAMCDRLDKYSRQALVVLVKEMKQLLKGGRDLSVLLRSPDTNAALRDRAREEVVSLRGDPRLLDGLLPKLPDISR